MRGLQATALRLQRAGVTGLQTLWSKGARYSLGEFLRLPTGTSRADIPASAEPKRHPCTGTESQVAAEGRAAAALSRAASVSQPQSLLPRSLHSH